MSMLKAAKNIFQLVALTAMAIVFQNGIAGGSSETMRLTDALSGNNVNQVLSEINNAKELHYQGEMIQLMKAVWSGENLDKGISTDMVKKDIIKINVADFLVQAHNNGLIDIDTDQFRVYAKKVLNSADTEAVSSALFVLANIDNPEDVKLIKPFILSKSDYLFRSATLALAMMCNDKSDEALADLAENVKGAKRDYLRDTREKFLSMKKKEYHCRHTE